MPTPTASAPVPVPVTVPSAPGTRNDGRQYWIDNETTATGEPCLVVRDLGASSSAPVTTIPPGCQSAY